MLIRSPVSERSRTQSFTFLFFLCHDRSSCCCSGLGSGASFFARHAEPWPLGRSCSFHLHGEAQAACEAKDRHRRQDHGPLSVDIAKAQKLLKETKTLQRNERRKKQRLIKKAAGLSSNDLERIAVIKRCGLWDPALGVTFDFTGSVELVTAAAAAVGEAVAVTGGAVPSVVALSSAAASAEAHGESEEEDAAAE